MNPDQTPTPETDADWKSCNFDTHIGCINAANKLVKRSRTLECQRDTARAEAKEAKETLKQAAGPQSWVNARHEDYVAARLEVDRLTKGNDALVKQLGEFAIALKQSSGSATVQIDALRSELATLRAPRERREPSLSNLVRLCHALEIDPNQLLQGSNY